MVIATKRKDGRQGLTEDKYFNLIEHAADGIAIIQDGVFKLVNTALARISGYDREELLGVPFTSLLTPESQRLTLARYQARLAGKRVTPVYEIEAVTKDGKVRNIEVNAALTEYEGQAADEVIIRDITERKRVGEELREAEEEKSALLEEAPIAIFNTDLKGKITYVNKRFESESGYSREEIIGKNGFKLDWLPAGTMRYFTQRMAARLRGGSSKHWATQFKRKDGRWIWIEIEGKVLRKLGVPVGFQIVARNITERKQADEELQAEKNKLQSMINAMEYGLSIQDTDFNIIYQSEPSRMTGGYHLGEKCYRAYEGKDKVCDDCPVEKAFRDGKSHTSERRIVTPSGEVAFLENTASPIRDASGEITSCLEITRDITQRKQAEEELQQSNRRFSDIVENALEWIWEVESSGKYTYASPVVEKILGYKPEEMLEKHFYDLFHPDDRRELKEAAFTAFAQKQPFRQFVNRNIHKNGETVWLSTSGVPILDEEGNLLGYRGADVDITERKQAEEELKLKAQILDGATDAIFVHDSDDNFIYVNEAACRTHGYTRGEFLKMKIPQLVDPERSRPLAADRQELLEKGHIVVESVHLRKDGSLMPVEIHARTLESGGERLFLTVARDITERKEAEEALKESEEDFKRLFELAPVGITMLDMKGVIIYCNAAVYNQAGYSEGDYIGKHFSKLSAARVKDVPKYIEIFNSIMRGKIPKPFEVTYQRKDGTTGWTELNISLLTVGGKRRILVIQHDITERKRAEEALKLQTAYFQQLFDNSPEAIVLLNENNVIVNTNKGFETLYGYTLQEVKGKPISEVIVPENHIEEAHTLGQAFLSNEVSRQETVRKRKDGSLVDVSLLAYPIWSGNKVVGAYVIYTDITERKRAEEELRQAKERFQALAEESPLGVSVLTGDGRYQYLNPRFIEMFGYTLEDIPTGRDWFNKAYPNPKYRSQIISGWITDVKSSKRGEVGPQTYNVTCKDGSEKIIHFRPVALGTGDYFVIYEDITERKKAEEALRESEEKYRTIFENVSEVIIRVDRYGKIVDINGRTEECFGYKPEEVIGKNFAKMGVLNLKDLPKMVRLFGEIIRGKRAPIIMELEAKRKDGSPVLIEVNSTLIKKDGKAEGFVTIVRDITERKQMEEQLQKKNELLDGQNEELKAINEELQATEQQLQEKNEQLDSQNEELRAINEELRVTEEELQQSQEKLERMFESVGDGIIVADLDGTIIKVNERAVQMHGFASESELLGKTAFALVAPSDHDKIAENMRRALKEGLVRNQEYTLLKKDGSEFPGELSTSILKDGWGNVVGHITISRDITRRKQMEELFRMVTNSSPVGIYIMQDRRFQMANPQFQKLTGYTEEELRGMDSLDLVIDEDRVKVREEAVKMLKGKRLSPYQFRVVNKAGETRWVMETVTSIQYRGRKATLGNYIDITERRQAEEREDQLQQELNLASRLASVGQLAAGVAHEINNPLTGVIGFSHLMLGRDIPDDIKQDLQVINSEAQRVAKIVENLLTFAHQRKPGRESVDINGLIARVLELRAYEMMVNNIEVETQFAPDLPYTTADAGQLQQVFLNIVLNAEHFMIKAHNRGKLLVKTERADGNIRVSFVDDGTGISEENLDKIFNPFFTTKEVGNGTGLGLSICHGIISQHKGRIYAQSELGKGATFFVELPIVDEPAQAGQAEVTEAKSRKPKGAKILVVDDELAILNFLRRLLTEWGHRVETNNNAETALKRLKVERYSLILLDIKLPGMSGIELYQRIEEIAPALTRRIMFITGDIMENATRDFLEKTGVPHITKPLNIELLHKAINRALNQTQVVAKTPG